MKSDSFKPIPPFAWQSKRALNLIREGYDDRAGLTSALAVYLVLTEFANQHRSATFSVLRRKIAEHAGMDRRTLTNVMERLREIGVVSWVHTQGESESSLGPNLFTLATFSSQGNKTPTPGKQNPNPWESVEKTTNSQLVKEASKKLLKEGEKEAGPSSEESTQKACSSVPEFMDEGRAWNER